LEDKARQVTRGLLEAASAVYAFPKNWILWCETREYIAWGKS
jgi:hypothetical protein